jgi:hypothetical protein
LTKKRPADAMTMVTSEIATITSTSDIPESGTPARRSGRNNAHVRAARILTRTPRSFLVVVLSSGRETHLRPH